MLEPTPYRISMPVNFLKDLTQIIFSDAIKQNQLRSLYVLHFDSFHFSGLPCSKENVKGFFWSFKLNLKNWDVLKFTNY